MVPDAHGHDIEYAQFEVIFTLTTFSFGLVVIQFCNIIINLTAKLVLIQTTQFDIMTMRIRYRVNGRLCLMAPTHDLVDYVIQQRELITCK